MGELVGGPIFAPHEDETTVYGMEYQTVVSSSCLVLFVDEYKTKSCGAYGPIICDISSGRSGLGPLLPGPRGKSTFHGLPLG